jgi:hypothetical protein
MFFADGLILEKFWGILRTKNDIASDLFRIMITSTFCCKLHIVFYLERKYFETF